MVDEGEEGNLVAHSADEPSAAARRRSRPPSGKRLEHLAATMECSIIWASPSGLMSVAISAHTRCVPSGDALKSRKENPKLHQN
jgi:hypothetical protein